MSWYLSVSCFLPVFPCSAAVPRHFHICGGGSSCRLCTAGHASLCFPPRTPHVWLLYLIDTHMSGTGIKTCSQTSNKITHTKTEEIENTGKNLQKNMWSILIGATFSKCNTWCAHQCYLHHLKILPECSSSSLTKTLLTVALNNWQLIWLICEPKLAQ